MSLQSLCKQLMFCACLGATPKLFALPAAEMMPLATQGLVVAASEHAGAIWMSGQRGHLLFKPTDGGVFQQQAFPTRLMLNLIHFEDGGGAWIGGAEALIARRANASSAWSIAHHQPGQRAAVRSLLKAKDGRTLAVGTYGLALMLEKDASDWQPQNLDALNPDGLHFFGLIALGNGDWLLHGESGFLALSSDEGRNWRRLLSPYEGSWFGALPWGSNGVLIFGLRGNAWRSRPPSTTAGDTPALPMWERIDTVTTQGLWGGTLLADGSALLVGAAGTVRQLRAEESKARIIAAPTNKGIASAVATSKGEVWLATEVGPIKLEIRP